MEGNFILFLKKCCLKQWLVKGWEINYVRPPITLYVQPRDQKLKKRNLEAAHTTIRAAMGWHIGDGVPLILCWWSAICESGELGSIFVSDNIRNLFSTWKAEFVEHKSNPAPSGEEFQSRKGTHLCIYLSHPWLIWNSEVSIWRSYRLGCLMWKAADPLGILVVDEWFPN